MIRINEQIKLLGPVTDSTSWLRKSRNLADYIRPNEWTQLASVKSPNLCDTTNIIEEINFDFILYIVITSPHNYKNRDVIRETWGKAVFPSPIFLMGHTDNELDWVHYLNLFEFFLIIIVHFIFSQKP